MFKCVHMQKKKQKSISLSSLEMFKIFFFLRIECF